MPIEMIESHSLLPDLVRRGGLVVDCGANIGAFSRIMVERFGCRVLAYEASPEIFRRIPRLRGLQAQNTAVSGTDGPVTLTLDEDITRSSIMGLGPDGRRKLHVPGRTLPRLLSEAGEADEIDVLKLDIEGAELGVIDSLPDELIRRIGQFTIEFHDFLGYHTTNDVAERVDRIAALGFRELFWSRSRNTGDVLLVNARALGPVRYVREQKVVRYIRAFNRLMRRSISG